MTPSTDAFSTDATPHRRRAAHHDDPTTPSASVGDEVPSGDAATAGRVETEDFKAEVFEQMETLESATQLDEEDCIVIEISDADGVGIFDAGDSGSVSGGVPPPAVRDTVSGSAIAELVATRAELRRVEGELQKAVGELRNVCDARQEIEREHAALGDAHRRLQADFDNSRRRGERTRAESHHALICEVLSRLLPVSDNLRRAAQTSVGATTGDELRQFVTGVDLICKQLDDVLGFYGVEPVAAIGEVFDPHVHEAIATEATDEFSPNTIVEEIVRGYRLADKLLRLALVKVAAAE